MFSTELWNVGQHGIGYIHLQRLNGFLDFICILRFLDDFGKRQRKVHGNREKLGLKGIEDRDIVNKL